jgi:hypothetical protein
MVFMGCAASVTTEQYVGEYEKQKSLDEVEITKVDGLKIVEVKFNKDVEERYPEFNLDNLQTINFSYFNFIKRFLLFILTHILFCSDRSSTSHKNH